QEIHQLQEELKTAKQFLKETQNYAEEMKNKSLSQQIVLEKKQDEIRDLEGKNQDLIQQLKKMQSDLQLKEAEITHLPNEQLSKIQLDLTTSGKNEPNKRLDGVQKELEEKEREMKKEISEYLSRLHQVEKNHTALLTEAKRKNEVEIQACQEKLNLLEQCLDEQQLEMELLKLRKEQLNNSLKDANQTIEELKKVQRAFRENEEPKEGNKKGVFSLCLDCFMKFSLYNVTAKKGS
ncbi:hypothetical protein KIL84_016730, partial [Mauremys mutica]